MGCLAAVTCAVATGALRVEQIFQVPLQQGQTVNSLAADRNGNLVVTGSNSRGGFVCKLDPGGNVVFSFSNFGSYPTAAAVDSNGNVLWAGSGGAIGFPFPFTKTVFSVTDLGSAVPGFVVKFRASDGAILWAARVEALEPQAIAVDDTGQITIAGRATVSNPPTTPGAYQAPATGDVPPMAVARLTANGDGVFLAAYGGHSINGNSTCVSTPAGICASEPRTAAAAVLLDVQGHIWVAGSTNEVDLPVTSDALQKTCGCGLNFGDGFLAEFGTNGSALLYATYLGTSGVPGFASVHSAAIDGSGQIWVAGATMSTDLPVTADAPQPNFAGDSDGFLLAYDPPLNRLAHATYYGMRGDSAITCVAIAPDGRTAFSGYLESNRDIPSEGSDFLAIRSASGLTSLSLLRNGADAGIAFAQAGVVLVTGTGSAIATVDDSAQATPAVSGISNGATANASAQVSPGEIVAIYGVNLGPAAPLTPGATAAEPAVPAELGGVRVLFDGIPAPLLYVSSNQINAIVPFATVGKTETRMAVENGGVKSLDARLGVVAATPAIVTTGDVNRGLPVAAAINQDGTVNSASNPAVPGTIVAVFGTGFGMMTPAPQDGSLVSAPLPSLSGSVNMFGGPGFVDVLYAGPAPAEVAGVVQVNFRVPANLATTPALVLFAADWPAADFTVWVKAD